MQLNFTSLCCADGVVKRQPSSATPHISLPPTLNSYYHQEIRRFLCVFPKRKIHFSPTVGQIKKKERNVTTHGARALRRCQSSISDSPLEIRKFEITGGIKSSSHDAKTSSMTSFALTASTNPVQARNPEQFARSWKRNSVTNGCCNSQLVNCYLAVRTYTFHLLPSSY